MFNKLQTPITTFIFGTEADSKSGFGGLKSTPAATTASSHNWEDDEAALNIDLVKLFSCPMNKQTNKITAWVNLVQDIQLPSVG
jgi:hypothetical protein